MQKTIIHYKKHIAFFLSALMAILLFSSDISALAKTKGGSNSDYKAGDNISMGNFDGLPINWTILNINADSREALIVARRPLYSVSIQNFKGDIGYNFRNKAAGFVPWPSNLWRYWLNDTFYVQSFSDSEKSMIIPTEITAKSHQLSIMNFYHDTSLDAFYIKNDKIKNSLNLAIVNNQGASKDNVFFLSSDEYTSYKDKISTEEKAIWPLRTSAYDDPVKSLYVNDSTGLIERLYTYDGACCGIRPAMTIKLPPALVDDTSSSKKDSAKKATESDSAKSTTSTDKEKTTDSASKEKTDSATNEKTQTANKASNTTKSNTSKTTGTRSKNKNTRRFRRSYSNNAKNIASTTKSSNTIALPNDSQYSMKKNGKASVTLDLDYLNSTDKEFTVTYKSSDADIFTVDSNGNIQAGTKNGSATLSVRMQKSNGKSYNMTCRIDVG